MAALLLQLQLELAVAAAVEVALHVSASWRRILPCCCDLDAGAGAEREGAVSGDRSSIAVCSGAAGQAQDADSVDASVLVARLQSHDRSVVRGQRRNSLLS